MLGFRGLFSARGGTGDRESLETNSIVREISFDPLFEAPLLF